MFELKRLHRDAIPAALARAERYRLLNEPSNAESICLDILEVDSDNREARVALLHAVAEQFDHEHDLDAAVRRARSLLPEFDDAYSRALYGAIICERRAKVLARRGGAHNHFVAYDSFRHAMDLYEKAIELSPDGEDDAILRWNTCARILMKSPHLVPEPPEGVPDPRARVEHMIE